jgi:hypothetical protein
VNCVVRVIASLLSERGGRHSACDSLTRRGQTHSALASSVGSPFPETNHEFVQSDECEVGRLCGVLEVESSKLDLDLLASLSGMLR